MSEINLRRPRTLKAHLQALLTAALMVLSPLLIIELLLQVLDPWGIRYFDDISAFGNAQEQDPIRGNTLPDGVYVYSKWQATMEDGLRLTPNTVASSDCEIVALGDSV